MQYAVRWPWEMTITTALFTFVLVLALRMRGIGSCELQVTGCQLSAMSHEGNWGLAVDVLSWNDKRKGERL